MPRANQGLYQLPELRLRKRVAFFEQVGVRVAAEEFNNVPKLLIRRLVANGEDVLKVFVRGPHLVTSKIDTLVEAVGTCHALEVHSIEFASATKREVVSDFIDDFERHDFVFMPRRLVKVVLVEQGPLGDFSRLWINDRTTDHTLAGHLETNAFQRSPRGFIEGRDGLAVEVGKHADVDQLGGVIVKQNVERLTELVKVSGRDVQVFDFEVVVDLEHQHLADGVDALENWKVPAAVQHAANLPNEP